MLFASELWRMYERCSNHQDWTFECLNYSQSDEGGLRHGSMSIEGVNSFKLMRHEGGVHRVQRVPVTERSGRTHTSTATVACLPQPPDDLDLQMDKKHLKIETKRASGAGGQHVNKTDSAVRIHHIPTKIQVECQETRCQHQNREKAMKKLRALLYSKHIQKIDQDTRDLRRFQVGTGDRSDKIRTYNFSQNRITDHRLNKTSYNLKTFLKGGDPLVEMMNLLNKHHTNQLLEQWINSL